MTKIRGGMIILKPKIPGLITFTNGIENSFLSLCVAQNLCEVSHNLC